MREDVAAEGHAPPAQRPARLAAAILSAGESLRMGSPKALLPYRGKTFLAHLMEVTRHPRITSRIVVLGAGADEIAKHVPPTVAIVRNENWHAGQISSIQAAVRAARIREAAGLLVAPVDHPLISAALIARLVEAFDSTSAPVILPVFRGRRGHPVMFRGAAFAELLEAPADVGARAVVWAHAGDLLEIETEEEGVVMNLNDPATMERALLG
jgi:molybdenum cofactor cytidylyltransferase